MTQVLIEVSNFGPYYYVPLTLPNEPTLEFMESVTELAGEIAKEGGIMGAEYRPTPVPHLLITTRNVTRGYHTSAIARHVGNFFVKQL